MRPDVSERTGMTVMEIDLPTGYVVMNDRLRTYVQSGIVPTLSRAEFYNKKIVFYIDYVREPSCFVEVFEFGFVSELWTI